MITVSACAAVVNQLLPEPHAGLLNGILFGTKTSVAPDLHEALIATGTIHITALSGMNITILEVLIGGTLLPWVGRRVAAVLTILCITGFVLFVGPSASVVRAAIMGSIALIAVIAGRQKWSLLSFGITCAVMLFMHPAWALDLSFQLSAGATLGIILFNRKQKNALLDDLHTTLAAQVFTIPILLVAFRRISLVSPLTNLAIGWIIQPLTALGLVTVLVGFFFVPLAVPLSWGLWAMLQYLVVIISATAKIPMSYLSW